jgi:phytoene dehydrogenase-like protein
VNNTTRVTPEKITEHVMRKYDPSPSAYVAPKRTKRDAIIIGGGHNGLISAAYLAKKGLDVLVLERRHCVGGAAVTEEMIPGFKFSRASYLAGLLRPHIIKELELEKYGFKYLPRNPSSFTPTKLDSIYQGKYLILGENENENHHSIAQFSQKDADNYPKYEEFLGQIREIMQPLLDSPPINFSEGNYQEKLRNLQSMKQLIKVGYKNKEVLLPFYELFLGPAQQILDRWFDSDILKATLATDAVIGASISPRHNGSAYVLLHHVMGEAAGKKGVWSYVEGGMGGVSNAIASSAKQQNVEIVTNATVRKILHDGNKVTGVEMEDGSKLESNLILSGTTPYHTFVELMPEWSNNTYSNQELSKFTHHIRHSGI